jgi:CII-binding regulator of phage lambda lysogenization HflD
MAENSCLEAQFTSNLISLVFNTISELGPCVVVVGSYKLLLFSAIETVIALGM